MKKIYLITHLLKKENKKFNKGLWIVAVMYRTKLTHYSQKV